MKKSAVFISVIFILLSCNNEAPVASMEQSKLEAELRAFKTAHFNAVESKDIESILGFYADDCISIPPNGLIQYGNDWMQPLLNELFSAYDFHEEFDLIDIQIAGDKVVASYKYLQSMVSLADSSYIAESGTGMCVLGKSKDGNWQFEWNAYNTDTVE